MWCHSIVWSLFVRHQNLKSLLSLWVDIILGQFFRCMRLQILASENHQTFSTVENVLVPLQADMFFI